MPFLHHPTQFPSLLSITTTMAEKGHSTKLNEDVLLVPEPTQNTRARFRRTRVRIAVFLASLLGLWVWVHEHKKYSSALSTYSSTEEPFVHWPLYIGDESDDFQPKKGHHPHHPQRPHRPPHGHRRILNGKPAEKIFLYVSSINLQI